MNREWYFQQHAVWSVHALHAPQAVCFFLSYDRLTAADSYVAFDEDPAEVLRTGDPGEPEALMQVAVQHLLAVPAVLSTVERDRPWRGWDAAERVYLRQRGRDGHSYAYRALGPGPHTETTLHATLRALTTYEYAQQWTFVGGAATQHELPIATGHAQQIYADLRAGLDAPMPSVTAALISYEALLFTNYKTVWWVTRNEPARITRTWQVLAQAAAQYRLVLPPDAATVLANS